MTKTMNLNEIRADGRHRKDLGDLTSLKASIEEVGLLHPVVVRPDGRLVAGARRLAALRELGKDKIPVTVAKDLDTVAALLCAERDENTCRLDMKPSEKATLGMALEELEKPKARARQREGQARGGRRRSREQVPEKFTETKSPGIQTREKVGEAVGMSGVTYQRAKKVVELAESGDVDAIEAMKEMDRTGKVSPAYNKIKDKIDRKPPCKKKNDESENGRPGRKKRDKYSPFVINGKRDLDQANKNKERMDKIAFALDGYTEAAMGDGVFDIGAAIAASTEKDREMWIQRITEARKALLGLKNRIAQEDK